LAILLATNGATPEVGAGRSSSSSPASSSSSRAAGAGSAPVLGSLYTSPSRTKSPARAPTLRALTSEGFLTSGFRATAMSKARPEVRPAGCSRRMSVARLRRDVALRRACDTALVPCVDAGGRCRMYSSRARSSPDSSASIRARSLFSLAIAASSSERYGSPIGRSQPLGCDWALYFDPRIGVIP
jgi:hypothetical protein